MILVMKKYLRQNCKPKGTKTRDGGNGTFPNPVWYRK